MRAVILAGGQGTRLRPYTTILPKPLVPIGERPILEHVLRRLAASGTTRADLCVGHLGGLIQTYFTQGTTLPDALELAWHWEDAPLGTAGALAIVPGLDETFICMNGDVLTTLDYADLVRHHRESGAVVTVATHAKRVDIGLGVVDHADGLIVGFREKPTLDYDVSMGVYVCEPAALAFLPGGPCPFPDLVLRLIDAGERVAVYRSDDEWFDIGTFEEHARAEQAVREHPERFLV